MVQIHLKWLVTTYYIIIPIPFPYTHGVYLQMTNSLQMCQYSNEKSPTSNILLDRKYLAVLPAACLYVHYH